MRDWTTGLVIAIGLVAIPASAVAQPLEGDSAMAEVSHVRSRHPALQALIARANAQSQTFRQMVETIDTTDGIVYVEAGRCRDGVRGCLAKVVSAAGHRFLFVKVDIGKADRELMALIGHELRHAVEVLSDPTVTDYASMYFFYKFNRAGGGFSSTRFETQAAMEAGEAVADEIRRFQPMGGR